MWFTEFLIFLILVLYSVSASKNVSIIVIGAGPSGIAVSTRLLENGFHNLTILEAENRIGGRVNSVKFGDAYVDLGGEWCHGQKDNVVYNLVKDYDVLRHFNLTERLIYSDGSLLDEEFAEEMIKFTDSFILEVAKPKSDKLSYGEAFIPEYNTTLIEKYKNDISKLKVVLAARDFFEKYSLAWESAFDWFELSYNSEYKKCEGDFSLMWNGLGYKTILDVMMQKFPDPSKALPIDDKILLSKEVAKISWKDTPLTVETQDGSKYSADHVIFTPSLGVLKAQHKTLFDPLLSQEKQIAISVVGFGAVMKILLHFPNPWWQTNKYSYGFIWSDEDKQSLAKQFPHGPVNKDGVSWLHYLTFFHVAENNPNVLLFWVAGDMVPEIENISDDTITKGLTFTLKKFFGKMFNVTDPDSMIHSSWYSNPHFRGTYSYTTISERRLAVNLHKDLAKALPSDDKPILLFAGEATNPDYFSTVHGAIDTGYREADRLIKFYDKN